MKVAKNSLYTRLVTRTGAILVISAAISLVAIWLATNYAANQAYDKILTSKALQIAGSTWFQNNTVNVDVPIAAISELSPDDKTFYAVLDTNGRTIAGDINFRPNIPWDKLKNGPCCSTARTRTIRSGLPSSAAACPWRARTPGQWPCWHKPRTPGFHLPGT